MPTFLEVLWANLYATDCARRFAAYSSTGVEVANMSTAQVQAMCAAAQAFADAAVTGTTPASAAALQAQIAALKDA